MRAIIKLISWALEPVRVMLILCVASLLTSILSDAGFAKVVFWVVGTMPVVAYFSAKAIIDAIKSTGDKQ